MGIIHLLLKGWAILKKLHPFIYRMIGSFTPTSTTTDPTRAAALLLSLLLPLLLLLLLLLSR
jgi:hypothetical protein